MTTLAQILMTYGPTILSAVEKFAPLVERWVVGDPAAKADAEAQLAAGKAAFDAALAKLPEDLHKTDAEVAAELAPTP